MRSKNNVRIIKNIEYGRVVGVDGKLWLGLVLSRYDGNGDAVRFSVAVDSACHCSAAYV
jgi:hypothetical protein